MRFLPDLNSHARGKEGREGLSFFPMRINLRSFLMQFIRYKRLELKFRLRSESPLKWTTLLVRFLIPYRVYFDFGK
jgi:hypothetical protein